MRSAHQIEGVGQVAGCLTQATHLAQQIARCHLTAHIEGADQVLRHLPDRDPSVGERIPASGQLIPPQQADLAATGANDASLVQAAHASVLGLGECLGIAERTFPHAILLEPGDSPAGVGIVLALILSLDLIENLIDETQSGPDRHRLPVGFDDFGIAREDAHAGSHDRLGQVDGGDATTRKQFQRRWQFLS